MDKNSILENISLSISIATPVILIIWFYYSQKRALSKSYFKQITGIYAGFTQPVNISTDIKGVYAGIIMNIRETDDKGYFKGEFDFAESKTIFKNSVPMPTKEIVSLGVYTFFGKMKFKIHKTKTRHPFKPSENRKYVGSLYILDRLDFVFGNYKIENYLQVEYDIVHYREMQTLKFSLRKIYRKGNQNLPATFTLYRKINAKVEPYKNVQNFVFNGKSEVDK